MTPNQVFTVAAIGGLAALLGLAAFTGLFLLLHAAAGRLSHAHAARRERRRHLKECRAIDALGTRTPNRPTR